MTTITNTVIIALFDGKGELITPTANFTPATGYPLSNLANSQLFLRARTPGLTADMQITWDFGSAVEMNVFALIGNNATLDTTRRFRAADDSGFTSNVVQSGAALESAFNITLGSGIITRYVPLWGRTLIYVHPTSITKRYYRWHQTDSANPDGYQEWGIARIGLAWQPQYGFREWRAIPKTVGPAGADRSLRGHEITFHNLTKDDAYDLQDLALSSLMNRRMLVIPEGNTPATYLHDAIWCILESTYVRETLTITAYSNKRYRVIMTFREVDR